MTDQPKTDWRTDGLQGLAALQAEDVPSFEIIFLDGVAAYVMGGGPLTPPYTVEHGTQVVACLLRAAVTAPGYRPDQTPTPTEAMDVARLALLAGAHALAARGAPGLRLLINRVIPAVVGELELHKEEPDQQTQSVFHYGLLAVASGPLNLLSAEAAEGTTEVFAGWDALIGAGFVPPWRIPADSLG